MNRLRTATAVRATYPTLVPGSRVDVFSPVDDEKIMFSGVITRIADNGYVMVTKHGATAPLQCNAHDVLIAP